MNFIEKAGIATMLISISPHIANNPAFPLWTQAAIFLSGFVLLNAGGSATDPQWSEVKDVLDPEKQEEEVR